MSADRWIIEFYNHLGEWVVSGLSPVMAVDLATLLADWRLAIAHRAGGRVETTEMMPYRARNVETNQTLILPY